MSPSKLPKHKSNSTYDQSEEQNKQVNPHQIQLIIKVKSKTNK